MDERRENVLLNFSLYMSKLKNLPSLREKKRYIIYEVISNSKMNFDLVKDALNGIFERFLGAVNLARANIIIFEDFKNQKGIIKVNNSYIDYVKAAFIQINKIGNEEVIVRSAGISGILNKAKERYF